MRRRKALAVAERPVPDELIEAARLDGCSTFGLFLRVVALGRHRPVAGGLRAVRPAVDQRHHGRRRAVVIYPLSTRRRRTLW